MAAVQRGSISDRNSRNYSIRLCAAGTAFILAMGLPIAAAPADAQPVPRPGPAAPASEATAGPARTVTGLVEDTSGGAIAGARVRIACEAHPVVEIVTDQNGQFRSDGLPAASCVVGAASELFAPREVSIDLERRQSAFVRLVLEIAGLESEVTVTPARGEIERTFDVPEAVSVATREDLESRPITILPQALRDETGVLVQQTTTAQGSPFIRGFSAQRLVYLLDGVRFNTATFRAGATQYLGWLNPSAVQRLEVVRGPASVQFGSDALGGSINVLSLQPSFSAGATVVAGHAEVGLGSADRQASLDAQVTVSGPRAALVAGGSARRVGELRSGGGRDSHSALARFLGLPSSTLYERLPGTDFSQAGGYVAASWQAGADTLLRGFYTHEEQHGVGRYDRLLGGDGLSRSDFDPQRLDFAYLRVERAALGPLAAATATLSLNRQQDDRVEQARPSSALERETSRVLAMGYQAQATWLGPGRQAVTFGGEAFDEFIASGRVIERDGMARRERGEIPDGTRYTSAGGFVQATLASRGGRLMVRAGARAGHFVFRTREDPLLGVARDRVASSALTFNTGVVWRLRPSLNATVNVGRGFRAANAYDLGAIGISGAGFEVSTTTAARLGAEIGTSDGADAVTTGRAVGSLGPESAYAFEAGLKWLGARTSASLTVFDMELVDIIQRRTAIFGADAAGTIVAGYEIVEVDGAGRAYIETDPRPLLTRVNVDRARIAGFEGDLQARLGASWIAGLNAAYSRGSELAPGQPPLRRMPPLVGAARVKWEPATGGWWAEAVATFAAPQERLSQGDLNDARIGARRTRSSIAAFFNGTAADLGLVRDGRLVATGETLAEVQARLLDGASASYLFTRTPGFVVVAARAGWRVSPHLDLTVIVDNVLDRNYRWHGSGVDAPGVNLQAKVRIRY